MSSNFSYPLKPLSRFGVLVIAVSWCALPAWSQTPEEIEDREGAFLEYSPNADSVLLEYDVDVGIRSDDTEPMLRIYGDGRVRVHRAAYRKEAGDYQMYVSQQELSELVVELHDRGMLTTSTQEVRRQQKEERLSRVQQTRSGQLEVTTRSDKSLSTVKINLTTMKRSGRGEPVQRDVSIDLRLVDVRHDGKEPDAMQSLRELASAEDLIRTYLNHPALRKVTN